MPEQWSQIRSLKDTAGQILGFFAPKWLALGGNKLTEMEGIVIERPDSEGGGISVIGIRAEGQPPDDPIPNAPVEIAGNILVTDGPMFAVVEGALTQDHYAILKPSVTLPDGRLASVTAVGPPVVYAVPPESATDNRDVPVLLSPLETDIITPGIVVAAAGGFPIGSILSVLAVCEENNFRSADLQLVLKVDGTPFWNTNLLLNGNRIIYQSQIVTTAEIANGEAITLHANYADVGGGAARDVRIRGDEGTLTTIEIAFT